MRLSMIVAVDEQMAIGKGGDQLAYISADLKHFKSTTQGHTVLMGRKTSEALPKGTLPNRRNIVITRNYDWQCAGAEVAHSLADALALCASDDEVFVIGGGELYQQCMPLANKLYITHIQHTFAEADTFFPMIDSDLWQVTSQSETFTDEKTGLRFLFECLIRKT